ncbi:MAG: hypothetical protein MZU79_02830 [Anaerotruncus sp.]|nr:hypothetical protein [Anaerotruncus sp.]
MVPIIGTAQLLTSTAKGRIRLMKKVGICIGVARIFGSAGDFRAGGSQVEI